jgi:adenylate cyclase
MSTPAAGSGSGPELSRRLWPRFGFVVGAANFLGAAVVFLSLTFVVPAPTDVEFDWGLFFLNLAVFLAYMAVTSLFATRQTRRRSAPIRRWLNEDRPPIAEERRQTLEFPLEGYKVMGPPWAGAAILFGLLNGFTSAALGATVAIGIVLGGLTTCAITILWVERAMRDVVALALAEEVPEQPVGPGVGLRMLIAWGLASGIFLLSVVLVSVLGLLGSNATVESLAATGLLLGVLGLGVGLLAVWIAGRSVADPVEEVRGALAEVERGNLEAEVAVSDGSEIGLLAAGFNRMVGGLRERERLRDLFGRHVGEDVARRAFDRGIELGGEVRECAVLFVDLVGSTAFAADRPPGEVVEVLNRFFGVVVDVVRRHGGWVNKFEGDAALSVFGAPEDLDDAAARALAAARELQRRLEAEVPELRAGIGVSAGPVVAGNVGAEERFEYTVIGDPVNEAARLTELAKEAPGRVLASAASLGAAGEGEAARWQTDDAVVLRGRSAATGLARPRSG